MSNLLFPPYFSGDPYAPAIPDLYDEENAAYIATLPTSDPHVVGQEWNNGGIRAISQG